MKTHARRGIRTATGLIIAVAGSAQASDLKDYITGTASGSVAADFYWPLENSFLSDLQTTAGRIRALGYEANGIYENDCTPPNAAPDPDVFRLVDYFPILPDHMTRAARSTALIFGETTGDLGPAMGDQVDRYLEFDFSDYTLQPMTFLGLHHQDEWTIHMVVSPDADDEDERGWETLFDVGDLYYTGVSGITIKPIRITLDADRQDGQTVFRIKTEAEGAPVRTASVTVSDATLTPVNGRPWYQVIAQYYQPGPSDPHRVRIIVHTITDGLLGNVTRTQASAESDEWRHDAGGSARMGLGLEGDNPFHGAIHHFAIWEKLLDTDDDVFDEIGQIATAFAATYKDPDPRDPLAIDWDAEPRFFIWHRPLTYATLTTRTPENWNDPLWDVPGVYPFVRFYAHGPDIGNSNCTPPNLKVGSTILSWNAQSGQTPVDVGEQAANWIAYIDAGLTEYASKSLHDANACALLWQNWGHHEDNCYYIDLGASRSLMRNWRDVRAPWRNASSHPVLPDIVGANSTNYGAFREIMGPFYREGMSINAFRSKDTFITLRDRIEKAELPMPTRLHFDVEERPNVNQAWGGTLTNNYVEGWWDKAMESTGGPNPTSVDTRSNDVAHWAPPTVPGGFSTLFQLGASFATDPRTMNRHANPELTAKFGRFARDQYDHAFGVSLVTPALQELNPDIRFSEYGNYRAGDTPDTEFVGKVGYPLQNVHPVWSDFSSPVCYPVGQQSLTPGSTGNTLYAEWGDYLGILDLLYTDDYADNGRLLAPESEILKDARTVFVELSKRKINASYLTVRGTTDPWEGEPIAPWLPYPGHTFEIKHRFDIDEDNDVDGDDVFRHTVTPYDVARIAAFAYRRGVREFLMWGGVNSGNAADVAEGLGFVANAVHNVRARPTDYTTTGAAPGDDDYGVPDGVADADDILYFYRFFTPSDPLYGNIEGDYSGPAGHPDGVVDADHLGDDFSDYLAQWLIDKNL